MKLFFITVFSLFILLLKPLYADLKVRELKSHDGIEFWLVQEKASLSLHWRLDFEEEPRWTSIQPVERLVL